LVKIKKHHNQDYPYLLSQKIISSIELSDSFEQKNREKLFIEDICKRVEKSKSVLYVLCIDDKEIGLVSLSVTAIEEFPSLQIDFLLVDKNYRGRVIEELDDVKASEYLIELSISIAKEIQEKVGLKYIVLLPDNDDLREIYQELNFSKLNKNGWMFISI